MNWFSENKKNRDAQFAGQFYPATKTQLDSELSRLFRISEKALNNKKPLQAIISPHAGYVFSGSVAASAYNQIPKQNSFKKVFVLASSHRYNFGGASIFKGENYTTPLGAIKIDTELANHLTKNFAPFKENNEAHINEHSLEVQLPFLQKKLTPGYLLVPIIIGTNKKETCAQIASALQPWFTPENLFVISTDLSHYPNYNDAQKTDARTLNAICSNNPEILLNVLDENREQQINNLATSLCGWTSVLTLLYITQNKNVEIVKIDYKNSGDAKLYADKNRVVGYGALAVFKN